MIMSALQDKQNTFWFQVFQYICSSELDKSNYFHRVEENNMRHYLWKEINYSDAPELE